MSPPVGYTEDALVERPALALLAELGWATFDAYGEFDHGASTLGRETKADVVLIARLRPALERLNPGVPALAIDQAVEELTRDRSRMSLAAANREVHHLLRNGVRARVDDPAGEGETAVLVQIIDWNQPANNDFLVCSQLWVTGEMYTRRADLVGFVNGLPLVFIELKASHRRLEAAYTGNLTDYKDTVPQLFWPNGLIILSNGSHSRVGSVTAGWEHFAEWKKVADEDEAGRVSLETMLRGTCAPDRLLDLVENFTVFQEVPGGLIKIVAKNHQYLGVNNALAAMADLATGEGRLGVFWHTQGSGKSISMIFFTQKVLRKLPGRWSFVIVTDRRELDDQIYKNFACAGVVGTDRCQADSSQHLRQLLAEDHRYVFTLIHKFRAAPGEPHPVLSAREDVIVITDEAHRSQYDTLALNMRTALPNASFLAFTGTPLIIGEERTRQVFGDYISVYDFRQSVADGATVPLYYENRIPELQLTNDNLNADMADLLEAAELDEAQEGRLEREFAREYHLITRDDRLEAVAADIVAHFAGRGFRGKAMVISIDKATAVRMYDKVRAHWAARLARLRSERLTAAPADWAALDDDIAWLAATDMAVVVSPGQNEIHDMQAKGLDIRPHRQRMVNEDLDTKFKNPADPLRLVFVCAMWMTGFDVPSCSTLYLDKPMRNHTLMQTIARANRVYPGKVSGLIVDYVGVFRNLEQALAIYGARKAGGASPVDEKATLVSALEAELAAAKVLLHEHAVNLPAIQRADGFHRIGLLDDAVEALIASDALKRRFLDGANNVGRLYQAILPDPAAHQFARDVAPIHVLADKIRALAPPVDITAVMSEVEALLDRSVAAEGYVIREPPEGLGVEPLVDLSQIDFEALAARFAKGHPRTLTERLRGVVGAKIHQMVRQNRTRMDFLDRFQRLIDDYNAGILTVEEQYRQLVALTQSLAVEDQRALAEQLSEEELAVFDLLTRPDVALSPADRAAVKATARQLLATLKREKLVLDWRKRQQARAEVRVAIEQALDAGLPVAYTPDMFARKAEAVFQHVYDNYFDDGRSVYVPAAA